MTAAIAKTAAEATQRRGLGLVRSGIALATGGTRADGLGAPGFASAASIAAKTPCCQSLSRVAPSGAAGKSVINDCSRACSAAVASGTVGPGCPRSRATSQSTSSSSLGSGSLTRPPLLLRTLSQGLKCARDAYLQSVRLRLENFLHLLVGHVRLETRE